MASSNITLVFLFLAALVSNRVTADISCNDALGQIAPCQWFLLGVAPSPDIGCCTGVASLGQRAAANQQDRRAICKCFKQAAMSMPINLGNAAKLPQLCNVNVGVAIDPNVNCDSI